MVKLATTVKAVWEYVQDLADVRGDTIMMAMSVAFIFRVIYAAFGHVAINSSEAAFNASAIASFAYSNTGKPKS